MLKVVFTLLTNISIVFNTRKAQKPEILNTVKKLVVRTIKNIHSIRVTFDGNIFILPKAVQKGLANYYTVIVWDRTDVFKHLLTRKDVIAV